MGEANHRERALGRQGRPDIEELLPGVGGIEGCLIPIREMERRHEMERRVRPHPCLV